MATEEAGATLTWMADAYLIDHCRSTGVLSHRQCDAAEELARLYCKGGGTKPWTRSGSGGEAEEEDVAAARARYDALLMAAPMAGRGPLATLAMGEWPVVPGMPLVLREGLDALADHLRLAA